MPGIFTLTNSENLKSVENLKNEGIHKNVFLTGNTVIDSINNLINNKMIKTKFLCERIL